MFGPSFFFCLAPLLIKFVQLIRASSDSYAYDDYNTNWTMAVNIRSAGRNVPDIAVQIQRLRIAELSIRNIDGLGCPVRRDESAQPIRIIPCSEVVEAGFGVAFFAGESVMVGVVVDEPKLAALSKIIDAHQAP